MSKVVDAPAGYTFTGTSVLISVTCPVCGIAFAIPQRMRERAVELGHGEVRDHRYTETRDASA